MHSKILLSSIAKSILAGGPAEDLIVSRLTEALGKNWRWIRPLTRRYLDRFGVDHRPRQRDLVRFLQQDEGFRSARIRYRNEIRIADWLLDPVPMQPVPAASNWMIPQIRSVGELGDWLGISTNDLEWFADLKRMAARSHFSQASRLHHYSYRILRKENGDIRIIEAPKTRLKAIQRQILERILEPIPAHAAVHGFLKDRSIKTFVEPHTRRRVVLKMDLSDFFPSISMARVRAFFRTAGYPEPVAEKLAGICTNSVPTGLWPSFGKGLNSIPVATVKSLYAVPHLPQGAPTSPALANMCSYRVDCRLSGLSRVSGASYTRYADDLAFSGDELFDRGVERFATHVAAILTEEGFTVHQRKTRLMRRGVRQRLAGIVLNERANVIRADFDSLKAILTNCMRHGPESQNHKGHPSFRMHLEGKVSFVEMVNPQKGARLRRIFKEIEWQNL